MRSFAAYSLFALAAAAVPAFAALATTTRYDDGQEGACGCGSNSAFGWQYDIAPGVYTAAGSQILFDADESSWCGAGCGVCYKLTNQGYSACPTCGSSAGAGESIIVMVSNLCPYNGNQVWCPNPGSNNQYGYGAHFDIMSKNTALVNGTWDNPVVEYEQVACPITAIDDWSQCVCYDGAKTPTTPTSSSVAAPASSSTKKSTTSTSAKVSTSSTSAKVSTSSSSSVKVVTTSAKVSTSSVHTSAAVSTSSVAVSTGGAALYGQCGGIGWTGATSCAVGSCVYNNDWYSQCLETAAANVAVAASATPSACSSPPASVAATEAALYGQCGGIGWSGPTTCAEGSTCVYNNDYYSQCLAETSGKKRSNRHRSKHIN